MWETTKFGGGGGGGGESGKLWRTLQPYDASTKSLYTIAMKMLTDLYDVTPH